MKQFRIGQFLIYNPKRVSSKRKAVQIDIQEAKILGFYPQNSPYEQKCNTVGMAEGVYSFIQELAGLNFSQKESTKATLPSLQLSVPNQSMYDKLDKIFPTEPSTLNDKISQSKGPQMKEEQKGTFSTKDTDLFPSFIKMEQSVLNTKLLKPIQYMQMDSCCLIQKEVQENIWFFLKLEYEPQPPTKLFQNSTLQSKQSVFDQELCDNIITHLYTTFLIFHGKITRYIFLQQLIVLQKIINYIIPKYIEIFSIDSSLNTLTYLLPNIRAIPLDVNSTLKFHYFKKVIQSYDPTIREIMIFAHGMLAYSSVNKYVTEYFANYFYGTGQPYKFESKKGKFSELIGMPVLCLEHFGTIYNSMGLGYIQKEKTNELVDVSANNQLFEVNIPYEKNSIEVYRMNFYYEKDVMFVTLYTEKPSASQLIFQNRFYHDNLERFLLKINDVMTSVMGRKEIYQFLFHNSTTFIGKSTIRDWERIEGQIVSALRVKQEEMTLSSIKQNWVYAIKRLSRLLLVIVPNEIPLQKLDQYVGKLARENLLKAFI